jgi:hypothetical protein
MAARWGLGLLVGAATLWVLAGTRTLGPEAVAASWLATLVGLALLAKSEWRRIARPILLFVAVALGAFLLAAGLVVGFRGHVLLATPAGAPAEPLVMLWSVAAPFVGAALLSLGPAHRARAPARASLALGALCAVVLVATGGAFAANAVGMVLGWAVLASVVLLAVAFARALAAPRASAPANLVV